MPATKTVEEYMPYPIALGAHKLSRRVNTRFVRGWRIILFKTRWKDTGYCGI
ncbi:MAG: hypothetical protein ACLTS6_04930 [Anaerobutyricum sp.]